LHGKPRDILDIWSHSTKPLVSNVFHNHIPSSPSTKVQGKERRTHISTRGNKILAHQLYIWPKLCWRPQRRVWIVRSAEVEVHVESSSLRIHVVVNVREIIVGL